MNKEEKLREIQRLLSKAALLEKEIADEEEKALREDRPPWAPQGYYADLHLITGFLFGGIAAAASLLFNVVGSSLTGRNPLEIIRVYLTFPMGEAALTVNNGIALGIGCMLYLATGAFYGMLIHYVATRYYMEASDRKRFGVVTGMAAGLWILNFYLILSWLQPALFEGSWIVDNIPWYVGLSTHLVFGWTVFLLDWWMGMERRRFAPRLA
jgi:hypothetical protein